MEHQQLIKALADWRRKITRTDTPIGAIMKTVASVGWPRAIAGDGYTFSVCSDGDRYSVTVQWSEGELIYTSHERSS